MRKYNNISANLVRTTKQLYDKGTSAFQMNGSMIECSRTTIEEKQWCLLSPTLFNIFFPKRIMSDHVSREQDGKVSIDTSYMNSLRSQIT